MRAADGTLTIDTFDLSPPQCGNSWLAWCLDAHPSISVGRPARPGPYKPPEVFRNASDLPFVGLLSDYRQRFEHAKPGDLLVDGSTYQLSDAARGAPRILEHNADARLLVVLRDPVARLFDHYVAAQYMTEPLLVPRRFEDALDVPGFLETSHYATHLAAWYDQFGAERVHIIVDTDLQEDPARALHDLYGFLGVNRRFRPDGLRTREPLEAPPTPRRGRCGSRTPEGLRSILRTRRHPAPEPELDPATEARLRDLLAAEIAAIEDFLGRDLEAWRGEAPGPAARAALTPPERSPPTPAPGHRP